jgi:hypothetical protein
MNNLAISDTVKLCSAFIEKFLRFTLRPATALAVFFLPPLPGPVSISRKLIDATIASCMIKS